MIELVCDKNRAFFRETEKLTSGSIGVTINFVFSPEWDGLLKTAVFDAGEAKIDVVLTSESCEVPPEVLACPGKQLSVGVFGELADKTLVIPTIYAEAGIIRPGASPSGMSSAPPTPSWPEQVQAIALEAKEAADSVRSDAEAGKFKGPAGAAGGFYTPAVTQPDANTMRLSFIPSKEDMPAVADTDITLSAGGNGLTDAQINALDGMFKVCAFIKADISAEYNAFRTAFDIEEATITGISATYSGGNVTAGTSVDELTGIVVTANYSDGSKRTVTGYTLSGTIAEGSNTITVTYEGMTTTFTVTGVAEEVTLSSISATYSGGSVPTGTALDDLTGIVVTAQYSDGSTATVTGYTLSGEIAEGSNTITVAYGGMTTTFTVTGVAEPSTTLQATNAAITTAGATDVWTAGYINDSGEVAAMDANYFYDEYLEAQGFVFLNSSNAAIGSQLRIAEYDSGKAFISRKLVTNTTYAIGDNSPSFIKCGFAPGINRSDIHTITPLIRMADLCTVKNVTIDTTGAAVEYDGRNATDYISLADSIGSFYVKAIGVSAIVALYDSDYALVDRITFGGGGEQLIAIPDGAKYIRICVAGDAVYTSLKFTAA